MLSHDVGVPLLHRQTCMTGALPCQDGLRLAFPLFIWQLLADIISPPSCLVTCLRATPAYSRVWPDDSPFLHCAYGDPPCSSSVYNTVPCTQNRAILSSDFFSKYTYSRVWQDDSSYLLFKYVVRLCSSNVNTSIPCTQNRAIQLSVVRIFEIFRAKILSKFKTFFAKSSVTTTLEIVFDPKLDK